MTESTPSAVTEQEREKVDETDAGQQQPMLYTENLTKTFGEFTAVNDVSFAIEPNETRALIGPNGAGKTTFQNLLTGALSVTDGDIFFKGENITNKPPAERAIDGMVRKYQVTSIYDSETVYENMCIALRGRSSSPLKLAFTQNDTDIRDRVIELLSIADLDGLEGEIAENLSHGRRQWLEIMMAVSAEPDLLLLDEPTSGMSVGETNDTVDLINDIIKKENTAVLVIEHDMEFIRKVANNITVLHKGEIIAEGDIDEIESNETVQEVYLGRSQ